MNKLCHHLSSLERCFILIKNIVKGKKGKPIAFRAVHPHWVSGSLAVDSKNAKFHRNITFDNQTDEALHQ
jgi:hypothetical protein